MRSLRHIPRGLFAVACAVGALVAVCVPAGASTPTWTESTIPWTTPGPSVNNALQSVSCVSETFCAAVGQAHSKVLADVFDGISWTTSVLPLPAGALEAEAESVSCTASSLCAAVGTAASLTSGERPLVYSYDGTAWTSTELPIPTGWVGAILVSVSCVQTTCRAVGFAYNTALGSATIVATNTGTGWTDSLFATSAQLYGGTLSSISCVTTSWCTAAGSAYSDSGTSVIIDTYDGTSWASHADTVPDSDDSLAIASSISCEQVGACVAEAELEPSGVAVDTLSSGTWTLTQPAEAQSTGQGISCVTTTSYECVSVGSNETSTESTFTAATDTDGFWFPSVITSPANMYSALYGVSCVSATWCVAVGLVESTSGVSNPVVATLSSGWTVVIGSAIPGDPDSAAYGVSCASMGTCTAVGLAFTTDNDREPVAFSSVGGVWSSSVVPVSGSTEAELDDVSCKATTCVAVGDEVSNSGVETPLVATESGGSWSSKDLSLPTGLRNGSLVSVSCSSTTSCVAVGSATPGSEFTPPVAIIATDTNGSWSVTSLARPKEVLAAALVSVSCPTSTTCVAVGEAARGASDQRYQAILSGGQWSGTLVASPAGTRLEDFTAVSCPSATHCDAAIDYETAGHVRAGIVTWSAKKWSNDAVATTSGLAAVYTGLSCPTTTSCVAVGLYIANLNSTDAAAVAVHSTGWSATSLPQPSGAFESELESVSCWSPDACTAVGIEALSADENVPMTATLS